MLFHVSASYYSNRYAIIISPIHILINQIDTIICYNRQVSKRNIYSITVIKMLPWKLPCHWKLHQMD